MEGAGVESFLHRRTIRFTSQAEYAAHGRSHQFSSRPARARTDAAEWRNTHVYQPRIDALDFRARDTGVGKQRKPDIVHEERSIAQRRECGLRVRLYRD